MKKIYTILSVAIAVVIAASCAKEENITAGGQLQKQSIEVTSESNGKTSLDGTDVIWNAGDAISVLYGTENKKFTTATGGTTAAFDGEASYTDEDDVYAVYPYSSANKIEDDQLLVTIPSVQVGIPGTFAEGVNVTVGKVVENKVQMKNVGGFIKLPIAGNDITSVTIRATNIVALSGDFLIDLGGDVPVATAKSTSNAVKLVPAAGKTAFDAGTYYIAIASVEMTNGFEIVYTKAAARGVKTTTNKCTISRSHILPIAAQDAAISFTAGRFVEIDFIDEDNQVIQPFTEDILKMSKADENTGASKGTYYLNCPEEYMFTLAGPGESGYFLNNGVWSAFFYYAPKGTSDYPCFQLPVFANKALSHVEVHSVLGGVTVAPYSLSAVKSALEAATKAEVVLKDDTGSNVIKMSKETGVPFNGAFWQKGTGTSYVGTAFTEFDIPDAGVGAMYQFQNIRLQKLVLFYAGEDVEEVTSVKAEIPASIGSSQTGQVRGSFKSWKYGQGGATYSAGVDYKLSDGEVWTTVAGEVSGQTFTAEIPSGLDTGNYVCRAWAGVDGTDGAKIYGPEKAFTVSGGSIETKTLEYLFIKEGATYWPFDADSKPNANLGGKVITLIDPDGNVLKAHYDIAPSGNDWKIKLDSSTGWRVRNQTDVAKNLSFVLDLPKFEKMKLVSVKVVGGYANSDKLGIVDSAGTLLTGGDQKDPKDNLTMTWNLAGTQVNTIYSIKTFPKGSGIYFDVLSITLKYESASE